MCDNRRMKKIIVAIGGGEIGRKKIMPDGSILEMPTETKPIDFEIIRLSGKKNPKLLFLGTASNDAEGYIDAIQEHFGGRLGCTVSALKLSTENPTADQIKNAILGTDIIYVGGGNTVRMSEIWKQKGVDILLRQAYDKGIVLSGLSAGANCWFKHAVTDSAAIAAGAENGTMLSIMNGLGFIDGVFVPHLLRNPSYGVFAEKAMMDGKYAGETFYLSDDKSALVSIDGTISGISADENSRIRAVTYDGVFKYNILGGR
jgi:peptidase E